MSNIVITPVPTFVAKGTKVKVTKISIRPGQTSKIVVGSVMGGVIENEAGLRKGHALTIKGDGHTSPVTEITQTEAGDFIFQTNTSVYFLQKI